MDPAPSNPQRGLRSRRPSVSRQEPRLQPRATSAPKTVEPQPRAMNIAGLEFGTLLPGFCAEHPGKIGRDYVQTRARTYDLLADQGFKTFRIPFRWERIQPVLGGPLDPDAVQQLRFQANLAARVEGKIILDLHNYGRYVRALDSGPVECQMGQDHNGWVPLTKDDFADLWARISYALCGLPEVAGYGLMNEPHDLGPGVWVEASTAAAEAIRGCGDDTPLYVSGDRWASSMHWNQVNPSRPWISERKGPVIYEAHCYFDHDGSGEYELSYEEELERDPTLPSRPTARLEPFLTWLSENRAKGFLGEFGLPVQSEQWSHLLPGFLDALDGAEVPVAWWAAGEGWGDYPLSMQPHPHGFDASPASIELQRGLDK